MNLPFVNTIHPKGKRFVTDVKIKTTCDLLRLNESPDTLVKITKEYTVFF